MIHEWVNIDAEIIESLGLVFIRLTFETSDFSLFKISRAIFNKARDQRYGACGLIAFSCVSLGKVPEKYGQKSYGL